MWGFIKSLLIYAVVTFILFLIIGYYALAAPLILGTISGIISIIRIYRDDRQAVEQARHEELLQALKDSKHKD